MTNFIKRMLRAAIFDPRLYEEVEADPQSMSQAMLVVILSSVAAGLAGIGNVGVFGLFLLALSNLIGWYLWAWVTYFVGAKLLPEKKTKTNHKELLRTIGFSSAPGIIRIFGMIPMAAGLVNFVAPIWMLMAMIIAVRQALDYTSTVRTVGVCLIGWIIQALVSGPLLLWLAA